MELREWSRITDELIGERNRHIARIREQLWRYFPAYLDLEEDVGTGWVFDLWELVPTPQKARRVRKSSVAEVLKRNRIRRFDADQVLAILRQTPVTVQDGAVAAATAHIETNECVALGSGSRFARPE